MSFDPSNHLTLYDDHLFGGLALTGRQSYYPESEPEAFFRRRSSSIKLTSINNTSRLQDPLLKCDRNLGWGIDWAVAFVVNHLEKKSDAAETLRNIRIRAATLEREGLTKEIPYRIFNKLDETLFAGHLNNAVFLESCSLGLDVSGATYTQNWGPIPEVKRISIILNSDVLEYARVRDVVAILIHHMIHAYFLVACGPQKEQEVEYGRLDHGVQFGKIMLSIRRLSAVHGKELTPLDFGHNPGKFPYYADGYDYPRRRPLKDVGDQKEKWYCSHCHSDVYKISEIDIDKYYDKVCKPMLNQPSIVRSADVQVYNDRRHELEKKPRAQLASSTKSVEFLLKDKLVLVEKKKLERHLSIQRAFEDAKSRYIKTDKEVSEKTFMRFLELLHTDSYLPDLRIIASAAATLGMSRKGPPIIKPSGASGEPYLLADVQFAKFASLIKFDECRAYALGRMNAYGIMTEDPVAVLQEIYTGREPDSKLKEWARKFLVATPTPAPLSSDYFSSTRNLSTSTSPLEPPNLLKLESEAGLYRARLHDAMENSGALENDIRKAWQELKNAGWVGWDGSLTNMSPSSALLSPNQLTNFRCPSTPKLLALGGPANMNSHLNLNLAQPQHLLAPQQLLGAGGTALASLLQNLSTSSSSYPSTASMSVLELERLQAIERQKIRELDREKERLKELTRKHERSRETTAALERFYRQGLGGYVVDDDRY
jgi:hypothetical protein